MSRWLPWQEGYGAFSIGISGVDDTVAYIHGQAEHHRSVTFEELERAYEEMWRRHGLAISEPHALGVERHGILHRSFRLEVYHCRLLRGRVSGRPALRWLDEADRESAPVSGATRKALARYIRSQRSVSGSSSSSPSTTGSAGIGPSKR